jgi:Mn-containing catalase
MHNKRLQYTVRVSEPDPKLATLMLEQFGGPQGELAAAMRYFTQALAEDDPGRKDMLYDIATEEMSHLEIIGSIFCMMNKGVKGKLAEGVGKAADLLAEITQGGESHTTSILYGGGAALVNSAGVPWTAAYIDVTTDPGVKDALGFLMTREVAHQKSFEKALYAIEPNFPPGKMPPKPEFASVYYNLSQGEGGDIRGPWNSGEQWKFVSDDLAAVDGGDGTASVKLDRAEKTALEHVAARTLSDPESDPTTGAELGMAGGAGNSSHSRAKKK